MQTGGRSCSASSETGEKTLKRVREDCQVSADGIITGELTILSGQPWTEGHCQKLHISRREESLQTTEYNLLILQMRKVRLREGE